MRPIIVPLSAAIAVGQALALTPALAQIQQLPSTSRSEAQTNAIAGSLDAQAQGRAATQQNQFEVNSLRTQNSMRPLGGEVVAPPIAGPAPVRR